MNIIAHQPQKAELDFIKSFLNPSTQRYILATNQYAKSLFEALKEKGLDIEAFVDDFSQEQTYLGVKIIPSSELINGEIVIAATSNQTKTIIKKIKSIAPQIKIMDYFLFQKLAPFDLLDIEFPDQTTTQKRKTFAHFRTHFDNNAKEYQEIFEYLGDKQSKKEFENIINFRFNQNLYFLEDFKLDEQNQYFEDFLGNPKIFFDIGGYQGETSMEFIKRYPDYQNIFIFEPNATNLNIAKDNLKSYKNITYFNIGVGAKSETLFYHHQTKQKDTSNHIVKYACGGEEKLQIDSIDNLLGAGKIALKNEGGGV